MSKGISPLAAALLLALIAVAAALVIRVWISSYVSSFQQTEPPQLKELLKVESVEYDGSRLRVVLRNLGSAKATVEAFYVIGAGGVAVFAKRNLSVDVEPGDAVALEAEVQLSTGLYVVKLVTSKGFEATSVLSRTIARPSSPPQEPGTPVFSIADWSQGLAGSVSSSCLFNVSVVNRGRGAGTALVKVYSHEGSLAAQTSVVLQPGEQRNLTLELRLPGTRGVYSWKVRVENAATGEVVDEKSFRVEAKDLYLKSRRALYFTSFEEGLQGWSQKGGEWKVEDSKILQGSDDDKRSGEVSLLYRELPPTVSLEVGVLLMKGSPPSDRFGIALLNASPSSSSLAFYAVFIDQKGGDKGFRVDYYDGRSWKIVNSTSFNPAKDWYTLLAKWGSGGLEAHVYSSDGSLKASLKYSPSSFAPKFVALVVDGGSTYFDNFVLTAGGTVNISVDGLQHGWLVELYSGSSLVGRSTAVGSRATLSVVKYLVVQNARMVVKDSDGRVVIAKELGTAVGGDEYVYGV